MLRFNYWTSLHGSVPRNGCCCSVRTANEETAGALLGLGGQVLPLNGLSPAAVGTLIAVIAGSHPSEEQASAVWRRSGGNPLFVRELTRLVLARGDSAGPLPDSVRQTLTERLARVSPACAEMLEVAAVDGLHLQLDVLSRALDLTSDTAADLLDEAVRARVVVLDDAGAHFAHDLFRETILAQLSSARRAALHAAVGPRHPGARRRRGTPRPGRSRRRGAAGGAFRRCWSDAGCRSAGLLGPRRPGGDGPPRPRGRRPTL